MAELDVDARHSTPGSWRAAHQRIQRWSEVIAGRNSAAVTKGEIMEVRRLGLIVYGKWGRPRLGLKPRVKGSGLGPEVRAGIGARTGASPTRPRTASRPARRCESCAAASDLVISAVTASNTLAVAEEAAPHLRRGSCSSISTRASPGTKQVPLPSSMGAARTQSKPLS